MEDLTALPNIGKVLAQKLNEIEVTSYEDLVDIGSVEAVLRIVGTDTFGYYNMLYALEGAILGIRWHDIPPEVRQKLKQEYDSARGK
ncbi:MAG: TfoX/Sxy family protein [Anaerolineales bacterium]|jgi:DNA transformation protein